MKHRLEYLLFRALAGLAGLLPHRASLVLAWLVAAFLFHALRFRRRETLRRIREVFGDGVSGRDARRIARVSLRNLAFNAVEMLSVRKFGLAELRGIFPGLEDMVRDLRAVGRSRGGSGGVLLAIPHMGNWDLAGSACMLAGAPIFSVAGRQRNPLMNALINELRAGHGMDILERGAGTLRQVLGRLRDGQFFAILPDTRSRQPDIKVSFLGGEANLARGMASFARAAKVPVVPVIIRRVGWRRFEVTLGEAVWPDDGAEKKADLERITKTVIEVIDKAIRETPEQWFWYNKRWVLDPL